jgi:predicted transcriptional regulator
MIIRELIDILDAEILVGGQNLESEINSAFSSDMMSDILAYANKDQSVLITGLVNPQVVRTAEMMDMRCIVFVRGKQPDTSITSLAAEHGIILLSTKYSMFASCGLLYSSGLRWSN